MGSKFFQDLQGSGKTSGRTKTYDVNYADDQEEMASFMTQDMEVDEGQVLQVLVEEGDEDAHFTQDFSGFTRALILFCDIPGSP